MMRAMTHGLILLAVTIGTSRGALALGNEAESGARYFVGSSNNSRAAQGYFGVDVRDISPDQVANLKLKDTHGAEITLVDHDAPAGKAGLREHDVVLQMNGQTIEGQDQVRRMLHDSPPGKTIVLVISRAGQQMTITTQMSTHEEVEKEAWQQHLTTPEPQASQSDAADGSFSSGASLEAPRSSKSFIGSMLMNPSYTGAILEQMSTQLAGYFGATNGTGLLVRSVIPNSPAAAAGMQAGDVVIRANERNVSTTGDWAKTIKNAHGKPVSVVVLRDKKEQILTLTPDGKRRSSLDRNSDQPPSPTDQSDIARLGLSWMPRS